MRASRSSSVRSALASRSLSSSSSRRFRSASLFEASWPLRDTTASKASFLAACSPEHSRRASSSFAFCPVASDLCEVSCCRRRLISFTASSTFTRDSRSASWWRTSPSFSCFSRTVLALASSFSRLYSSTCGPPRWTCPEDSPAAISASKACCSSVTWARSASSPEISRCWVEFASRSWVSLPSAFRMRFTARLISSRFCTAAGVSSSRPLRCWWTFLLSLASSLWVFTCSALSCPTSFCFSFTVRSSSPSFSADSSWLRREASMSTARKKRRERCSSPRSSASCWRLARNRSASSFCSRFCRRSAAMPLFLLKAKLVFSSASFFAASSLWYSSRSSSLPDTCSSSRVRSLGLFCARLSTSPWNTRKLRALVWMPRPRRRSLYASHDTARPSRR
mmetsp:Transcript_29525/g.82496  ORF Transcript_29525/g.82496 Transcript_29525/m.82496 type:complete len:394 (-) Transcript_29525:323-1504(-)